MEEAARQRRERLAALKGSSGAASESETAVVAPASATTVKRPRDDAEAEDVQMDVASESIVTIALATVEGQADAIRHELRGQVAQLSRTDVDLFALAPKKADHDLKTAIEPKLRRLEHQTQAAIVELIRR